MSINIFSKKVRRDAARWADRILDDDFSDAEQREFQRWLMESDLHQEEFLASSTLIHLARDLGRTLPRDRIDEMVTRAIQDAQERPSRRKVWLSGLAASLIVCVSLAGWFGYQHTVASTTYLTVARMARDITLPDGSVVHLNSETELRWLGHSGERKVALLHGEALFEVKHDSSKPFTVVLDSSQVRVLGTRFNVHRRASGDVVVTVLEGTVEVSDRRNGGSTQPTWSRTLHADEQLVYNGSQLIRDIYSSSGANGAKWREGTLEFSNEPLSNVIEDLGRYTDHEILIRDPRIARMLWGGQLDVRDVKGSMGQITQLAPVSVQESGNTFILDYRQEQTKETH